MSDTNNSTQQNKEQRVIFKEGANEVLLEILQKYDLKEEGDKIYEKIEKNQPLFGKIIVDIARDAIEKKLQDEDIVNVLQQKLSISKEMTEKIAEDIKTKLIPLAEKIMIDNEEKEINQTTNTLLQDRVPIGVAEALKSSAIAKNIKENNTSALKRPEKNNKIIGQQITKESDPKQKQSKKQDNYRESIG